MNFRRILIVSGSHLLKRTVAAPATARVVNSHLWKRDRTTVAAPASSSGVKADLLTTRDRSYDSDQRKVAAARQRKKRKVLEKLRNLTETGGTVKVKELLNAREEEDDVSITQSDLVRWAKLLHKEGKSQHALEVFEWMESEKMTFSPNQLATFVELIGKIKGYTSAKEYFDKVHPNFDNMNSKDKGFPAYQKLVDIIFEGYRTAGARLARASRPCWM